MIFRCKYLGPRTFMSNFMNTNQTKAAGEPLRYAMHFKSDDVQRMCGVLNFDYRSVCGITTLPSRAKHA